MNRHKHIESIIEGFTVDSIPFDTSIGKVSNLPIVHVVYAYDNPQIMHTFIIRFNHTIYIKGMDNVLLYSNQALEHGIIVDDIPQHFDHTGNSTFSIITLDTTFFEQNDPTVFLQLRRPTNEELKNYEIKNITNESKWDQCKLSKFTDDVNIYALSTNTKNNIYYWLLNYCDWKISVLHMSKSKDKLTPEYLVQIWKCGQETARKTIEVTTCMYYHTVSNGLTKRFRYIRDFARYRLIKLPAGEFYTSTIMSNI